MGKGKEAWTLIFCLSGNKSGKFGGSAPKTPEIPVITNSLTPAQHPRFGAYLVLLRLSRYKAKEKKIFVGHKFFAFDIFHFHWTV